MEPMGKGDPTALLTGEEEEEEEEMKELTQGRGPWGDQVWHSACHLADFPLGLCFLPPVKEIHYASKYKDINGRWIATYKNSTDAFSKVGYKL